MTGRLALVGVGPGDPELLTLKAVRLIHDADVVAYPRTGEGAALALSIAHAHIAPMAERMAVDIPMLTEREPAKAVYRAAAETILKQLEAGRNVVWLCEGDPLFYGSAMYVLAAIGERASVEVVPGVTSLTAAAAAIARPLAGRNDTLKVLPAPLPDATLRAELDTACAVAIIKVGRHFDRIRHLLEQTGHSDGAIVVEHATAPGQRITPLEAFAHGERPYFSTILCYRGGEVRGASEPGA